MDAPVVRLFIGALFAIVFAILISIPFGRLQERCLDRQGGELLSIRTSLGNITKANGKFRYNRFGMANRVMRSKIHSHCLVFRINNAWHVMAGDSLTVKPVPDGDLVIWFVPNNAPLFIRPDDTTTTATAPLTSQVVPTNDGWEQLTNSTLSSPAMQPNTPIQRFQTLAEAKTAALPCPAKPGDASSYIVGGSVVDPTYYLVQPPPGIEAVTASTAGTSVYRRVCGSAVLAPTPVAVL